MCLQNCGTLEIEGSRRCQSKCSQARTELDSAAIVHQPPGCREQTGTPMSLPKTLPFRKPLVIAGPLPHVSEIRSAKPFDTAVNLSLPSRIAVIGNYLPRQCGIATFTTDLCDAVSTEYETERLFALPGNDPESEYSYPERG